jgi:hypothetical protein
MKVFLKFTQNTKIFLTRKISNVSNTNIYTQFVPKNKKKREQNNQIKSNFAKKIFFLLTLKLKVYGRRKMFLLL